ncbi:MAG: peptidoglycan-binding domain-containing protein [Bacteroidota bacterium]
MSDRFRVLVCNVLLLGTAAVVGSAGGAAGGCAHTRGPPPPATAVPATKPERERAVETGISVAATPQGLMKDGAEKAIQRRLHAKGLLGLEQCNGLLDADTRQALRRFQKSEGLPTTGLPGYETVTLLGLDLDAIFHTTHHPVDPTASGGASIPESAR